MSDRIVRGALGAALLIGTLAACSEQIAGSLGCPALCSNQTATLRDTTLTGAVVLDSVFSGFPRLGESRDFILRNEGDAADVRLIARFDTLPTRYRLGTATEDSLIRRVDSATLIFRVDTVTTKPSAPITIDAFDVDTTATDTLPATLIPLFRPSRRIGSQTFQVADIKDTLRLTLDNATLLRKITDSTRLRIGLQIRGAGSVKLRVVGGVFAPRVRFRVSADSTVRPDTLTLRSKTPAGQGDIANLLALYPLIVRGQLGPPPVGRLVVGGLAGARGFLQFEIPPVVLDSVQVIRASLLLTQIPSRSAAGSADTITLHTQPIIASPGITDLFTASTFLGVGGIFFVDSVRLVPRDSGVRSIELVNLVRLWRAVGTGSTARSVILRTPVEGTATSELSFVSMEGPVALRPRLRLTYVPRRGFGIP